MARPDVALAGGSRERFDAWMTSNGVRSIESTERYRLWGHLEPFAGAARQLTLTTDKRYGQRRVFNLRRAKAAPLQALGELSPQSVIQRLA